jgi:iron(III) transport system ATP-binding protein
VVEALRGKGRTEKLTPKAACIAKRQSALRAFRGGSGNAMQKPHDDGSQAGINASQRVHVRIRGVNKRFADFFALRDITLDIGAGELVCFLGPSGCGKTTLLRVIAGLERQNSGQVEIGGTDVSDAPPFARDFGIVFQSYALFPNLTAADNVAYGLVSRRTPRATVRARVDELLALVGLPEQGAKYPAQLSGGQQQRVALARALAPSPSLLLLDEPLSALDARVRVRLREEIKDLQRRLSVTTIMVTHDQEEALAMADRIVVMEQGRIVQVGTPSQIYSMPATPFVADFIGSMNFVDARVVGTDIAEAAGLKLRLATSPPAPVFRLGFRPEDIRVGIETREMTNAFRAEVIAVEFLGSFGRITLAPVTAPQLKLRADIPVRDLHGAEMAVGSLVDAAVPPSAFHMFAEAAETVSTAP